MKTWKITHKARCARTDAGRFIVLFLTALAAAVTPAKGQIVNTQDNQPVVATVAVGQDPVAIAVNPVTDQIYVANSGSNTVTVIDGATNATIAAIPVGAQPSALAVNDQTNMIYVANQGNGNVTVINGATESTSTIATGGSGYNTVAVNPLTNQIFVGGAGTSIALAQIDGATQEVSTLLQSGTVYSLGVNLQTNTLYVSVFGAIDVINIANGSLAASIPVPAGFNLPNELLVNQALNQVYIGSTQQAAFLVLNCATNSFVSTGISGGGNIAFNPATNQVILALGENQVYNAATNATTRLQNDGNVWSNAAIDPLTNQMYVISTSNVFGTLDGTNAYAIESTGATGSNPAAIVVNPVIDYVYVVNSGSNNVTVISGASNKFNFLGTLSNTFWPDVNPFTNTGYLPSDINDELIAVNGATDATTDVATGGAPQAALVNPLTNQVYSLDNTGNDITVVNGANHSTTTVATGKSPLIGAINPYTNIVYVFNADGSLTVLNGITNSLTNLSLTAPESAVNESTMAINLATNQLYVADYGNSQVHVINGYTNAVTTYPAGEGPFSVAVNPVTNMAYVANVQGQSLTVLNGATGATATLPLAFEPFLVAVNDLTNTIYVAGSNNGSLALDLINGANNQGTVTTYPVQPGGFVPSSMIVDPVTNRVYLAVNLTQLFGIDGATGALLPASETSNAVELSANGMAVDLVHDLVYASSLDRPAVVTEEPSQAIPLSVSIGALPGNMAQNFTPSFTLTASDGLDPNSPPVENVYYRFDTLAGPWTPAAVGSGGSFTAAASAPLAPGFHVLLAWAANGQENGVVSGFQVGSQSPLTGPVARYGFYVPEVQAITIQAATSKLFLGATEQLTATALLSNGNTLNVTDMATWTSSLPAVLEVSASGQLTPALAGSASITASYSGNQGSIFITTVAPVYHMIASATASLGAGNYVVQVTVTNEGNTALTHVTFASAELNKAAAAPPATIAELAVKGAANFQLVFPASAGRAGSTAILKMDGTYVGVIPFGKPQDGSFELEAKFELP